jgi:PAS domain S-box-containing protein
MDILSGSEFELAHFFEVTPDLVCIAGKDGFFKKVNNAVIDKFGYTKEELYSMPISSLVHPEDKERTQKNRMNLLAGEVLLNFVNRYITKMGDVLWLEWTSVYFAEREIVFAIAKDITKRKQIEIETEKKFHKFRSLATHFKNSIEKDRKFLAYELHEELAQLAAVLKMQLDIIPITMPDTPAPALEKIERAGALADLLLKTIQRISFSISPAMLEEFGLNATLEWLCKEFSILSGIACTFNQQGNADFLSKEVQTDFFRICQESLSNVMYHSQASGVQISLEASNSRVDLKITDDGKGFDVHQQKISSGLQSMRELADSINAILDIQSEKGKGTKISISVAR